LWIAPQKRQTNRKKGRTNRKKGRIDEAFPITRAHYARARIRARKNKKKQDKNSRQAVTEAKNWG
jgi:hypothetical protein